MMKSLNPLRAPLFAAVAAAAALVAAMPAQAGFVGLADPAAWTTTYSGTLMGGGSPGSTSHDSAFLSITGGDDSDGCQDGVYGVSTSPCRVTVSLNVSGLVSFDWFYVTSDSAGPEGDIFGVLVDGLFVARRDPGGAVQQGGSESFQAAQSFAFVMNCSDCQGGTATVRIGNFLVVSEPASLALLGAAGLVLAWRRRRGR